MENPLQSGYGKAAATGALVAIVSPFLAQMLQKANVIPSSASTAGSAAYYATVAAIGAMAGALVHVVWK